MIERLCSVDVSELVAWIMAISFEDWPQQSRLADGKIRPAMAGETWRDMKAQTEPIVAEVMALFPELHDYNRLLSVVMPLHEIDPHCDPQPPGWCFRVHVPLTSNEQSRFISGGVDHRLEPGFAYRVDTTIEHAVENDGDAPRIHLMWDVKK